jgi:hypothetical protein
VTDFFEVEKSGWEITHIVDFPMSQNRFKAHPIPRKYKKANSGHHPPLPAHREEEMRKDHPEIEFSLCVSCFRNNPPSIFASKDFGIDRLKKISQ